MGLDDRERRAIRAQIANKESLLRAQQQNASSDERGAQAAARDSKRLLEAGRYVEGKDAERRATELAGSARNTRSNLWRLENEIKGLENRLR